MNGNLDNTLNVEQKNKKNESKIKKFLTIFGTSIFLLIPIGFMAGIIDDRINYRDEAISKVTQSWAESQKIYTPSMYFKTTNSKNTEIINEFNLNNYEATINIKTEVRKKGIFKVPVYTAEVTQKGDFENTYGNLNEKKLFINTKITDNRGFINEPYFKINNSEGKYNQDTIYTTTLNTSAKNIPFEITYKIKGLNKIEAILGGNINKISMNSNWKDPEFKGDFLPTEREVKNNGFNATWSVPKIALSNNAEKPSTICVSLLVPVDNYSLAGKSLKYGYLLLTLTFLGYFIFEITSKEKRKIHPIQYCLLGMNILIFYLLLVSFSEFLAFYIAYLISSVLVLSLIYTYTYFVITRKQSIKFSLAITSTIGLLYTFFYLLLMLKDISLITGSFGLFVIIAFIMYLTRNVDWYNERA